MAGAWGPTGEEVVCERVWREEGPMGSGSLGEGIEVLF